MAADHGRDIGKQHPEHRADDDGSDGIEPRHQAIKRRLRLIQMKARDDPALGCGHFGALHVWS
jgi:hypothetical protein